MIRYGLFIVASTIFTLLLSAQNTLKVQAGAVIYTTGGAIITLQDMNLDNDGTINQQAGEGKFIFSGTANNTIAGSSNPLFDILQIQKTGGAKLLLLRNISIGSSINFSSGLIDLNNNNILLQPTAFLVGEGESSHITGPTGGYVEITNTFNPAVPNNFGNLGAVLTSSQNLGSTRIRRGHQSQTNGGGQGNSIFRYFDISPSNNTALNATLRFHYFDAELYAPLIENSLVLWKSIDNVHWTNAGFTSRDVVANYVEKTGIADFSRWTLSSVTNPLPVHFTLFTVYCQNNNVLITWRTAQEQNSSNFQVQKSVDGINFSTIGIQPASGNSNTEKTYSFTDHTVSQHPVYYRICETDINGRMQYTPVNRLVCGAFAEELKVWPNPVRQVLSVNINTAYPSAVSIKLFDSKGALVLVQYGNLLRGSNLLNINTNQLASGSYNIILDWNNGQSHKAVEIIKQ